MHAALRNESSHRGGSAPAAALERSGVAAFSEQPRDELYFRVFGPYRGAEPEFYSAADFPWTALLEEHWREVRAEFEHYCKRHRSIPGHFVPDRVSIQGWKGVKLVTFRRPYRKNLRKFPQTVSLLESIPGLVSASINVLEPGTVLPVHNGDSNLCYRVHLGLSVPAGVELCGIQVGSERRGWEEGRVLVFNDAHPHFVWNNSSHPRVILLCDVLKPPYRHASARACAQVLATIALLYLQFRIPQSRHWPPWVWRLGLRAAAYPFVFYLGLFGWRPTRKG